MSKLYNICTYIIITYSIFIDFIVSRYITNTPTKKIYSIYNILVVFITLLRTNGNYNVVQISGAYIILSLYGVFDIIRVNIVGDTCIYTTIPRYQV